MDQERDDLARGRKRRRVTESCKVCRAKKTRCDGQRPSCSACLSKDLSCEYSDTIVQISVKVLEDIRTRLERLEQRQSSDVAPEKPSGEDDEEPGRSGKAPEGSQQNQPGDTSAPEFPENSTMQFIQDMTQIAQHESCPSHSSLHTGAGSDDIQNTPSAGDNARSPRYKIPAKDDSDLLLDSYEQLVYPLFPILYLPTFRQEYNSIWDFRGRQREPNPPLSTTFYATLNIVFSLAYICLPEKSVLSIQVGSQTFYRRARTLLSIDAIDEYSLELLQYLLLTANYLSFTKYGNRSQIILAATFRVAQCLGLHNDVASNSGNQVKREMSRRLWHLCLTFERLYPSIFGTRPVLDANEPVPIPSQIDDEYLSREEEGYQPPNTPSLITAFIITIDIFKIMDSVPKYDYEPSNSKYDSAELSQILQIYEKTQEVENKLPIFLRLENGVTPSTSRERKLRLQAEALMIRILYVRLVLLRPTILTAARHSLLSHHPVSSPITDGKHAGKDITPLEMTLQSHASTLCLQAAISAINILHRNLQSSTRIISSMAVFVTLSAATIVIAASLVDAMEVDLENKIYKSVVERSFSIFESHLGLMEGTAKACRELDAFLTTVKQETTRKQAMNVQATNPASTIPPGNEALLGPNDASAGLSSDIDLTNPLWAIQWDESIFGFGPGEFYNNSFSWRDV